MSAAVSERPGLLQRLFGVHPRAAGSHCAQCRHFCGDPKALEQAQAGLAALSSGHGSVPGHTGLCLRHHCLISRSSGCSEFDALPG